MSNSTPDSPNQGHRSRHASQSSSQKYAISTGSSPLLILPTAGWLLWFLMIPLMIVIGYSFMRRGPYGEILFQWTFANYTRAIEWIYFKIFWNSLKLAMLTTLSCLLIGYPVAYVMATSSRRIKSLLLILIIIPFWTNFVVRTYALKLFFSENGPIGLLFQTSFLHSHSAITLWFGMVTNYLPFMVMPLFVAIEKFDFSLFEAARDLGATSLQIFWRILVPLTKTGIVSGSIFVFTPALGEFVIPDLLTGGRKMLMGNLILDQFLKTRDWPFGSALSLILIVTVMLSLLTYLRMEKQ